MRFLILRCECGDASTTYVSLTSCTVVFSFGDFLHYEDLGYTVWKSGIECAACAVLLPSLVLVDVWVSLDGFVVVW